MTDRRQWLGLALAGASALCLPRGAWGQVRWPENPFALGVASGSPTADSVVLWTRLVQAEPEHAAALAAGGLLAVAWEVADDALFRRIVRHGRSPAEPALAHSVHAEVDGLAPDRWYYYRFVVGGAVSPVGRTRTLPVADAAVARWRMAYASCQKWEDGYFSAWRHLRDEDVDAVLFLGDYLYEYPGTGGRVRQPAGGWVLTLDDYRNRYAQYKSDPDLQAMHQACPWLMGWDDHEVQNDYAGEHPGNSGARDPASPADFARRRSAAYQAWYEHMPLRAAAFTRARTGAGGMAAVRVHERVQIGRLASFHLLDGRQHRDVQVCTRDGQPGSSTVNPASCPAWMDARRSMLGAEQERWLEQSLARRDTAECVWSVIGQQTVFGQRDFRPGPGSVLFNDGWDGYSASRTRLTDALQRHRVPNPVVLGGDVHANWVGHIKADYAQPSSATVGVEFCGTSITSRGGGNAQTAQRLAENPHFVFADAQEHGYG
ncbi:MAG: alkaline phosphatase D family protein, partial [Rhodoferax sp.]